MLKLITNVQEHTLILWFIMLPTKSRQLEEGIAVAPPPSEINLLSLVNVKGPLEYFISIPFR